MKESTVCEVGDDDINTNIVQYNDFKTANPNILRLKVLRSHLQLQTSQTQISIKLIRIE